MIPVDLRGVLRRYLSASRRPPDGLLHASSDLIGSLRHSQLSIAGAPKVESEIASDIRLMTGTMWHKLMAEALVGEGVLFMQEIKMNPWLPEGWGGTADWLFWDAENRAFVLGDLKTTKGEGIRWIMRDGAKAEHLWQLSAYWHALYDAGFSMVEGFGVLYLPMNDTSDRNEVIDLQVVECTPIPREKIHAEMAYRWARSQEYLTSLDAGGLSVSQRASLMSHDLAGLDLQQVYLTPSLEPEQPRVQDVKWNSKQKVFDVVLAPHWSAAYCPFPVELCGCSQQGQNKIGHYTLEGIYVPRKDYEDELPMVEPTAADYRKKRKDTESLEKAA